MRKDAKIGFAIGGVLLAVLAVYAIVVPKHKKTSQTVALVTPPPADSGTSASSPSSAGTTMIASGDGNTSTVAKDPIPAGHDTPAITPAPIDGGNANPATHADATKPDDTKPVKPLDLVVDHGPIVDPDAVAPAVPLNHRKPTKPAKLEVEPTTPASDRVYVVKSGQTLSSIAEEIYGNPRFWVAIQRENKSINANHLKVGEKINLPDITPLRPGTVDDVVAPESTVTVSRTVIAPDAAADGGVTTADGKTYIVKVGDSLYKIARTLLGSGRKADALYALNKEAIGPDKTKLKPGTVLKLPEGSTTALASSRARS